MIKFSKKIFITPYFTQLLVNRYTDQVKQTSAQLVAKNLGMNRFLNKTYLYTGSSLVTAFGSAYFAIAAGVAPGLCIFGGLALSLGGIIGMYLSKSYPRSYLHQGYRIYTTENSMARKLCYASAVMGVGLSSGPLLAAAHMINPALLLQAMALTTAIFGGVSMMAYRMPPYKMLGYGNLLFGGLIGIIGLSILGMLSTMIMGPNMFGMMAFQANTYLGLLLFSGLIAYDTHVAMKMYQQGNADHLGCSFSLFLNIWNIFSRILIILMNRD